MDASAESVRASDGNHIKLICFSLFCATNFSPCYFFNSSLSAAPQLRSAAPPPVSLLNCFSVYLMCPHITRFGGFYTRKKSERIFLCFSRISFGTQNISLCTRSHPLRASIPLQMSVSTPSPPLAEIVWEYASTRVCVLQASVFKPKIYQVHWVSWTESRLAAPIAHIPILFPCLPLSLAPLASIIVCEGVCADAVRCFGARVSMATTYRLNVSKA